MKIKQTITEQFQTNCYLVYDETGKEAVLIDPGERVPVLEDFIEQEGLKVKKILLTHGHLDHILAAEYYKEKYEAKIGAHHLEKEVLEDPLVNLTERTGRPLSLVCDEYYEEGDRVEPFGFEVIDTPGHTCGSCSYMLKDWLFTGDALFHNSVGRWDLPTGNLAQLMETLGKLLHPDMEKIVYPGHGQSTDTSYERITNPFSADRIQ